MAHAVKVLTEISMQQIIRNGGIGDWSASANKILQFPYVVCVRHGNRPASPDDVSHRTAFLIGRISAAYETANLDRKGNPRVFIAFDEYAEIAVPNLWGESQNPVGYFDLNEAGIDVDALTFIPVGETHHVVSIDKADGGEGLGLSFAEARVALATYYRVDPQAIEISIRG